MSKLKKPIEFKTAFESYIADEVIGEGGSGRVYKAQDEAGNICAIKTLNTNKASKAKLKRFKNESLFCNKNQHKNILTVTDYGLLPDKDKIDKYGRKRTTRKKKLQQQIAEQEQRDRVRQSIRI